MTNDLRLVFLRQSAWEYAEHHEKEKERELKTKLCRHRLGRKQKKNRLDSSSRLSHRIEEHDDE